MESETGAAMDSIEHGDQSLEKLTRQYKNLEKAWSQEKERRTLRRSSSEPRIDVNALQLIENSPRCLMSALQQHGARSPLMDGTSWKVRTNEFAVMEAFRETMEAFPSGKWKGRRLFHDVEGVSEMVIESGGEEEIMCKDLDDWGDASGQESDQVRSIFSYDSDDERGNAGSNEMVMGTPDCWYPFSDHTSSSTSSSSFLCKDCIKKEMAAGEAEKEKEEVVVMMASVQEDQERTENGVGYQKRLRISKLWIALAMLVFATSIILATTFKSFGNRHEMILVPT